VLNGVEPPCRLLVADWPSIGDLSGGINQMTVFQIIMAVLRCLSGLRVGLLCAIV